MKQKIFIIGIFALLSGYYTSGQHTSGQCPERAALWKRIIYLKDSATKIPPQVKLNELLQNESALQLCHYTNDSVFAFLLEQIASSYFQMGEFVKAVEYEKRSIRAVRENADKPSVNRTRLVRSYYRLSDFYDTLNLETEKIKAIDSCISIGREYRPVSVFALYALYERADYSYKIGDFQRAQEDADMGELLVKKYLHGTDSAFYCTYFQSTKITCAISLGQFAVAESMCSDLLEQLNQGKVRGDIGTTYDQLGLIQFHRGEFEEGISSFNKAVKYCEASKYFRGCQEALTNLGFNLFEEKKDSKGAIQAGLRAIQYLHKNNSLTKADSFECLNTYTNIANAFSGINKFDSAEKYYQFAFDQVKPGANETSILHSSFNEFVSNVKIEFLPNLLRDKADAYLRRFKVSRDKETLAKAIQLYKAANQLINRIKTEDSKLLSKLYWRSSMQSINQHAIEACYLAGNIDDAFYFFENSRAILLNDQLSQQSKMDKKEILDLAQIKREVLELEKESNQAGLSSFQMDDIKDRLYTALRNQSAFEEVLKQKNPLYYQGFEDTSSTSVPDVQQKLLEDRQGLLELFAGDSAVYSLLITPHSVRLHKLDKKKFDSISNQYVTYISNASLLNNQYEDFVAKSHQLYELIFQGDPVPSGRIIISPDGRYFPFEALVVNNQGQSPVYFVEDHAVSYTYSARYLMNSFSGNDIEAGENFLGVAPVNYSASFSLASLPASDRSLLEIGSYLDNTQNLIAGQASKTNFLQQFSKFKIIQLYTHSSENSTRGEPVIYFADSALYLSELIPESIPNTRLIVLSACETGNGRLYRGEGVFSFNRGFASMGIPSSVINLWAVDNKSTYKLIELFYKYVAEELPIDIAMQKAKLDFIRNSSKEMGLPYYWAAPIIAGRSEKVYSKKSMLWMAIVAAAGLAGLSFIGWKSWRQKRNQILTTAN